MSEADLKRTFRRRMGVYGKIYFIETPGVKGRPDSAWALRCRNKCVDGWTEMKYLASWPKRPSTSVCIAKLTLEQVIWQENHHAVGGRVTTLLQVGRSTFLLLTAPVVRLLYERRLTAVELMAHARVCSTDGFPAIDLLEALTA